MYRSTGKHLQVWALKVIETFEGHTPKGFALTRKFYNRFPLCMYEIQIIFIVYFRLLVLSNQNIKRLSDKSDICQNSASSKAMFMNHKIREEGMMFVIYFLGQKCSYYCLGNE